MNFTTLQDETTASRVLSLIERHAPKFMKGAFLGLPQEMNIRDTTEEDRKKIISLAATAPNIPAIASAVGFTNTTVRKVLRLARVATPFERITGIIKGPGAARRGPRTVKILAQKHSIKST